MPCFTRLIRQLGQLTCTLLTLLGDGVRCCMLRLRSSAALTAENLFLRKQLALYEEADGEGLQPLIPLGRRAVASLTHHNSLGCGPRVLRPMVAVGRGYNAQGPSDTSIGRSMWEERAIG